MAWYAYCITEQGTIHPGRVRRPFTIDQLRGINGAPVLGYPSGDFVVVATEFMPGTQLPQQAIVDHSRIVSECFKHSTVLPFKFGTVFETEEALRLAVRANRKAFSESVSRLRGKAEMHLKLVVREDSPLAEALAGPTPLPPARVGSEYLAQLKEQASKDRERQSKARALSVQAHKLVNPLQEDIVCKKVNSGISIDIAHLIDSDHVTKYQNRYSTAMRQFKGVEVSFSGPWPPYHFVRGKMRAQQ